MSEIIDFPQSTSMVLGSGYDLVARNVKLSPLNPVQKITEGHGPDEIELAFIESSSHLSEFLDVGVEGSLDSLVFKASAKAKFVQEMQMDEYSLAFVVHVRCVKGVEIANQPTLNTQAKNMVNSGNLSGLKNSYGDHYVSALTRGGELFGSIRIVTRSVSERESLRTELAGSGFGWSARAQVEARLAQIATTASISVSVKVNGISGYTAPTNVQSLLQLAERFPILVQQSGTPIKAELRPLGELPEVQQPSMAIDDETRYALLRLSNLYLDYRILANNIAFMLSPQGANRFDFDQVNRDTVQAQRAKVEAKMREIEVLSNQLLTHQISPKAPAVTGFTPAYVFDNQLNLPNAIEILQIPTWAVYPLRNNTRGDSEMGGHKPSIYIATNLSMPTDHRTLNLGVSVRMVEGKSDWTTFEDSKSDIVFDLRNTGLKIVKFSPESGSVSAKAGEDDHDWHWYAGVSLAKRAECRSDVRGKETGKIGARAIEFNPVKVIVAPLEPPQPTRTAPIAVVLQKRMSIQKTLVRRV